MEIRGITKRYRNSEVVKGINLTISKGEFTSIIGPNGAGKSTLLGMISRTIPRDGGEVLVNNKDILSWNSNELSKTLSILKQGGNVHARVTVRDLVEFGRYPYNPGILSKEDMKQVEMALEYMSLVELEDRYLDELSGGQRQRAYIASLLAQDTEYILLDEPLNNLDMKYASDLLKVLRRLVDELGKTIVIVIHDINIASKYSDRIVLLKNGELAAEGTPLEIMKSDILNTIYDMEFKIREFENELICSYS